MMNIYRLSSSTFPPPHLHLPAPPPTSLPPFTSSSPTMSLSSPTYLNFHLHAPSYLFFHPPVLLYIPSSFSLPHHRLYPTSPPHHPPCPSLHLPFIFTSMPPHHPRIRLFTLVSFSSCHLPHSTTIYILLPLFISSSPPMSLSSPALRLYLHAPSSSSYPSLHPRVLLFMPSSSLHHHLYPTPPLHLLITPMSLSSPALRLHLHAPSSSSYPSLHLPVLLFMPSTSSSLPHHHLYPTSPLHLLITPMCLSSPALYHLHLHASSSPSYPSLHPPVLLHAIYLIFITPPPSISYFPSSPPHYPPCPSLHLPLIIYGSMPPDILHPLVLLFLFSSSSSPHPPVRSSPPCPQLHLSFLLFIPFSPSLPSLPLFTPSSPPPIILVPFSPSLCAVGRAFHC
ncbi:extensin-2-like isoform X1 [Rana temporaria]|uniref:extensin-2-like isoform X1 n=1 Tax=Rana temporaria TaxID=8407 RepID=UPI001AAD6AFA|nr:extensin-2-like isoform X1 [Rana temporaria]